MIERQQRRSKARRASASQRKAWERVSVCSIRLLVRALGESRPQQQAIGMGPELVNLWTRPRLQAHSGTRACGGFERRLRGKRDAAGAATKTMRLHSRRCMHTVCRPEIPTVGRRHASGGTRLVLQRVLSSLVKRS